MRGDGGSDQATSSGGIVTINNLDDDLLDVGITLLVVFILSVIAALVVLDIPLS